MVLNTSENNNTNEAIIQQEPRVNDEYFTYHLIRQKKLPNTNLLSLILSLTATDNTAKQFQKRFSRTVTDRLETRQSRLVFGN